MQDRRSFLKSLAWVAALGAIPLIAEAGPRRRRRRKARRRVHRRVRRRVRWRTVSGRRLLVVPAAVAVEWELALDDRVVVVKEVHEHHVVIEDAEGKMERLDVVKEDTDENKKELEGSEVEDDD